MPRVPTRPERADIEYYMALALEDLLGVVGRASDPIPGTQYSPDEAQARGKQWLESIRRPLRQKLCVEWGYCEKKTDPRLHDRAVLVATVADLLIGLLGGVPALMASTLLVRMGLDGLCDCPP